MSDDLRVVVLVPRRDDGGLRDRLWEFCRTERWGKLMPQYPIFEGYHYDGPFNRAAAINVAAAAADLDQDRPWDVALIIDSDVLPSPEAVAEIVTLAYDTNRMCVSHNRRVMLSQRMTRRVLNGDVGSWESPTQRVWEDSCSCCIAVSRTLWDMVGGFDEGFIGWGFEDSAFAHLAKQAGPIHYHDSTLYHLWHPTQPEASPTHPLRLANARRLEAIKAGVAVPKPSTTIAASQFERTDNTPIPRIFHRTVPETTTDEVEMWWAEFEAMHPGWEMNTVREPVNPADFPLTSAVWPLCKNGAQKAGLIRLELLVTHGGIYLDSDVMPVASFEPLLGVEAFCAWEDEQCIPDAVLGSRPDHPAFVDALNAAVASVANDEGAWKSGPGVTTSILPNRPDVLCLPPTAFYPVHYLEKARYREVVAQPPKGCFAIHMYHHSWGTPEEKANIERNQRR